MITLFDARPAHVGEKAPRPCRPCSPRAFASPRFGATLSSVNGLPADRASRIILIGFACVIVALAAFCLWAGRLAERRESQLAQVVVTRDVGEKPGEIRSCLGTHAGGLGLSKMWHGSPADEAGLQGYNHLTDIGVRIRDTGTHRVVQITTARGRPLREAEILVIRDCLR